MAVLQFGIPVGVLLHWSVIAVAPPLAPGHPTSTSDEGVN